VLYMQSSSLKLTLKFSRTPSSLKPRLKLEVRLSAANRLAQYGAVDAYIIWLSN